MARYGVSSGLLLTHGGKAHWLREKLQEKIADFLAWPESPPILAKLTGGRACRSLVVGGQNVSGSSGAGGPVGQNVREAARFPVSL